MSPFCAGTQASVSEGLGSFARTHRICFFGCLPAREVVALSCLQEMTRNVDGICLTPARTPVRGHSIRRRFKISEQGPSSQSLHLSGRNGSLLIAVLFGNASPLHRPACEGSRLLGSGRPVGACKGGMAPRLLLAVLFIGTLGTLGSPPPLQDRRHQVRARGCV